MTTKVGLYRDKRNKHRPWVVRWFGEYDPEKGKRRQYSKSFARKRDAEVFRAAKQAELDRGGVRDVPDDITVGEFVRRFLESKVRNRRPATRATYRHTLEQLVAFVGASSSLRSVTHEVADCFVATRARVAATGNGFSPWSRKRHLVNAKTALNSAVQWGYLAQNPFNHIRPERCVARKWHHLTPTELQQVLNVVSDLRWRAFYLLAYTTGARFGELFNLTWSDIDFERCVVTVQNRPATREMPPFHIKDYETRTLLLPRQAVDTLIAWQAEAPESVPYILLTADRWQTVQNKWSLCRAKRPWKQNGITGELEWVEWENRYMVNNVRRDIRGHLRRAGIETTAPFTVHTLRKSFGQNHANAGTPIHVLQQFMGHASITTTRKFYLQAADANERDALARYETLLDAPVEDTCVKPAYEPDSAQVGREGDLISHVKTRA